MSSIYGPDNGTSPEAVQSRWQNIFLRGAAATPPVGPFTMTFDELTSTPDSGGVQQLYTGLGTGPNYHVEIFGGLVIGEGDPFSNFNFEPSQPNIITFLTDSAPIIFNATGDYVFQDAASIYFCTRVNQATFEAWSGINGTGVLLAQIILPETGTNVPPGGRPFSVWDVLPLTWVGNAKSLLIGGDFNFSCFDSISAFTVEP